jgi:hypothetical protein
MKVGHISQMGEKRNAYYILVGRREDNRKVNL